MVYMYFCKFIFITSIRRYFSVQTFFKIERICNRSLIRLTGEEIWPFLQGLITNDVNYLKNGTRNSLFAFFLNNRGRVLYDTLMFKKEENEILLECDSSITDNLINHLKMYRIRKKVTVEKVNNEIWVFFNKNEVMHNTSSFTNIEQFTLCSSAPPSQKGDSHFEKLFKESLREESIIMFKDPRLRSLGYRIIVPASKNISKVLSHQGVSANESEDYTTLRYQLGVAEGVKELPRGNCFPLEANCDYLHGVSFHKGCYIGQELTARTHHTGIVRKRLMPLIFSSSVPEFEQDSIILTEDEKKIGKLRGVFNNYGIALLKITEALESGSKLKVSGISASTFKPFWWPQELKVDESSKM